MPGWYNFRPPNFYYVQHSLWIYLREIQSVEIFFMAPPLVLWEFLKVKINAKETFKTSNFSLFCAVPKRCTYFAQTLAFIKRVSWIPAVLKFLQSVAQNDKNRNSCSDFRGGIFYPMWTLYHSQGMSVEFWKKGLSEKQNKKRDHLSPK